MAAFFAPQGEKKSATPTLRNSTSPFMKNNVVRKEEAKSDIKRKTPVKCVPPSVTMPPPLSTEMKEQIDTQIGELFATQDLVTLTEVKQLSNMFPMENAKLAFAEYSFNTEELSSWTKLF